MRPGGYPYRPFQALNTTVRYVPVSQGYHKHTGCAVCCLTRYSNGLDPDESATVGDLDAQGGGRTHLLLASVI